MVNSLWIEKVSSNLVKDIREHEERLTIDLELPPDTAQLIAHSPLYEAQNLGLKDLDIAANADDPALATATIKVALQVLDLTAAVVKKLG